MPKLGLAKKIHAKHSPNYVLPHIKSKAGHSLKWLQLFDNLSYPMTRISINRYMVIDYNNRDNMLKIPLKIAVDRLEFHLQNIGESGFKFPRLSIPDRQFII